MGVTDAPQWLLSAWRRSVEAAGATAPREQIEAYGERLIERWTQTDRVHHNLRRLIGVLARVDELAGETHHPDVVRLAAWYHGAIFDAAARRAYAHRGGVDEHASAALARTELTELGVPEKFVNRIADLIAGLSRHVAPEGDMDAQALCDADLGGLAAEPQRYEAYRREVREEYGHIPQRDYVEARLAIVTRLLARTHLFRSPLGQAWEDAAHENLTAELARLTHELHTLPDRTEAVPSSFEDDAADASDGAEPGAASASDGTAGSGSSGPGSPDGTPDGAGPTRVPAPRTSLEDSSMSRPPRFPEPRRRPSATGTMSRPPRK